MRAINFERRSSIMMDGADIALFEKTKCNVQTLKKRIIWNITKKKRSRFQVES